MWCKEAFFYRRLSLSGFQMILSSSFLEIREILEDNLPKCYWPNYDMSLHMVNEILCDRAWHVCRAGLNSNFILSPSSACFHSVFGSYVTSRVAELSTACKLLIHFPILKHFSILF